MAQMASEVWDFVHSMLFLSGSVLSLPIATHFYNLFLFLVRIRPDLTMGTQLIFFLSCYPFVIFVSQYLTHCHLRTKQSVSDTHKIRCTYLWDSSATPFHWKPKKQWPRRVLHPPAVCPQAWSSPHYTECVAPLHDFSTNALQAFHYFSYYSLCWLLGCELNVYVFMIVKCIDN